MLPLSTEPPFAKSLDSINFISLLVSLPTTTSLSNRTERSLELEEESRRLSDVSAIFGADSDERIRWRRSRSDEVNYPDRDNLKWIELK